MSNFLNFILFLFHSLLFCFVPLSLSCMICNVFCNALNRICISSHPALLAKQRRWLEGGGEKQARFFSSQQRLSQRNNERLRKSSRRRVIPQSPRLLPATRSHISHAKFRHSTKRLKYPACIILLQFILSK
jgi:hypothetical protein